MNHGSWSGRIFCAPTRLLAVYHHLPSFPRRRFWIIALPCVAVISPLFIIPDIKKLIHYLKTRQLLKVRTVPFGWLCRADHALL